MKRRSFIAVLAFVAANSQAVDVAKQGRAAVALQLKDPESARFRDAFVNGSSYCGQVNAKNSYGGYVGFKRFAAAGGYAYIESEGDDGGIFDGIWREACWPKDKLNAYHKKKKELADEADRDIERQRAEIRVMMDEKNRAIEAESAASK
jgi:hypothetical protein